MRAMPRLLCYILAICIIFTSLIATWLIKFHHSSISMPTHTLPPLSSSIIEAIRKSRIIIMWNSWFGNDQFWEGRQLCSGKCIITHHREFLDDAVGVLVHLPDINMGDLPRPRKRGISWTLFTQESPTYWTGPSYLAEDPETMRLFDFFMSYRLDSDFPLPYVSPSSMLPHLRAPLPLNPHLRGVDGVHVAWVCRNCDAKNGRHLLVKELMKYIPVHSYGGCLNNRDWPSDLHYLNTTGLYSRYAFVLALENSNCRDYVTEKLVLPFMAGSLPIVDGPDDYSQFIPTKKSVIRADAFKSVQDLAIYIQNAVDDEDVYTSHFDYKTDGKFDIPFKERLYSDLVDQECDYCNSTVDFHENAVDAKSLKNNANVLLGDGSCEYGKWQKRIN